MVSMASSTLREPHEVITPIMVSGPTFSIIMSVPKGLRKKLCQGLCQRSFLSTVNLLHAI